MEVGDELPIFTKKAKVMVPPGGYPWGSPHNEEFAKSLGFKGALVPAVVTLGYISEWLLGCFGEGWVKGGKVDVSFISGVVDGETVTLKGIIKEKQKENSKTRLVLDVWMENEEAQKVIVGIASGLVF